MKHKLIIAIIIATLTMSFVPIGAYAADDGGSGGGSGGSSGGGTEDQDDDDGGSGGGSGGSGGSGQIKEDPKDWLPGGQTCSMLPEVICNAGDKEQGQVEKSALFLILVWILNILTATVGIVAVGALVFAGIIYTSAGGDASKVQKAKQIITDTVIGVVAYGLMYLALNWLIPGGVIR